MKNNTTLFHFLCSNLLRRFANKNSCTEKNTVTANRINKRWILMPLMVLTILFTSGNAWGQNAGFFGSSQGGLISYDLNGAATVNSYAWETNIGNARTLVLKGGIIHTWKNGSGNVCGGNMYYRVYKQGASAGSFSSAIALSFSSNGSFTTTATPSNISTTTSTDQRWANSAQSIDLRALATSEGTWVIEVYFDASMNISSNAACNSTQFYNNSSNNYKLYFDITRNPGFEADGSSAFGWLSDVGAATGNVANTINTSNLRSGSRRLLSTLTTGNLRTAARHVNYIVAIPASGTNYIHALGWVRTGDAGDLCAMGLYSPDGGTNYPGTASATTLNTYARFTMSGLATNSKSYVPELIVDSDFDGIGDAYGLDDVIIYTSTSSGADVTKPNAPSSLTSSRSGSNNVLSWTNGTDNATNTSGIEGTLIVRVAGDKTGSITNLSNALLDQAYYATVSTTGPTTISDGTNTWTIVSNGTSSATYTDASSTDVTYAFFMRDKAYNYSSGVATYVPNAPTVSASGGVVASSPGSGTSGYVGNTITINGTNLGAVNVVKVGGSGGTSVTITGQTATTLTFVAINAGGTIYVQNQGGNATSTESYTNLGYISNAATDWNTTTTWLGSAVPVVGSTVTINHAVTVNSTATNVPSSVTINSTKSLTFGASGSLTATNVTNNGSVVMTDGGTLNIAAGGTFANGSNTFTRGTGTVTFAGTGTVTGTIGFNNVTLAGTVNFGTTSTINGTLTINSGGSVSTNAPTYANTSLLKYNTGGTYGRGTEWSTTSGAGYPNDVQVSNNTTLDVPNTGGAFSTNLSIARDLTIDVGSSMYMDYGAGAASGSLTVGRDISIAGNFSLGDAVGGDLSVGRNWTHTTGTFSANSRAVTFNGASGDQTITNASGEIFSFLTINKATSGGVTLGGPVTVSNTLTLTKGVLTTTSSNLLSITNTSVSAISGGNSTSYINGPLRWSVSNGSGGDYKFHVGKSSNYLPLNVNNPTGTFPVITAEAFVANAGGSAGSGLASLSTSEYWSVVNTGTLSAATISLAKASIGSNNGIGTSTTLAGNYNNLGGSVTNTLIASNTVTAGTTVGSLATTTYFVLGVKVAAPTITSFTPSSGYVGTTITITGTNFTNASAVTIGGLAAASYTIDNSTQITVTASTGTTGTIAVTTPGGTAISASTFTFGGYISNAATDWNTASTWLGGAVPPAAATVTIDHAVTVNGTATNNPSSVTINSTKSLTFGASGALTATTVTNNGSVVMTDGGTLNIATGGTLANGSNTFTRGAGIVAFAGTGTVTGTIGFNNVTLAGGVNFGTTSTINGTLTINGGGFVNTNAPTYASTSTLLYNSGSTYGRGTEWSATSGTGYPNNVQISNSTTLNLGANSGTATARQLAGNLTVDALSSLTMNASGEAMTAALIVKGNYINNGTTTLSGSIGGDLALEGNLTDNNVFNANGRAIFFRGGNTQSITSNSNPLDIDVVRMEKTGGEVLLLQNLLVDETADPIKFEGTSSILNLNGYTATLGKASTASTITMNSTSAIKGSSTSSLIILGTGAAGTIRFDQTAPGTTNVLQNLTINRTSTGTVTLGNALTVGGNLTLTDGTLTVGGNTLTYAGSSIARTSGVIDASNVSATLAFTNTSALTLPASLFSSNVNNLTMNGTGGVTLGSATTVAGVLNLLSGDIITSSTNTLTLSSTASITNGGSSSYIEGPLDRTLANGSSFSYPIGGNSTNYRPLNLNSVVATGNPVVRVTVAETGATTVDGTTLESLLNSRNWRVEQISGTFTSATLVITESSMTDGTHKIGKSNNNQVGTYVSVGTPQTVSAGAITSPAGQGVGFYAIGVKASCTNPTAGGTIAETQTICSGGDPATFTSSVAASGNVGTLEYKWQYSSTSDFSTDINEIASSNAETYDAPSGLTATRYYRRLARVSCKADWTGAAESNILMVTVRSAFTTGEISSTGQTICSGGTPTEIGSTTVASGGDASITYSWRSSSDSYLATIDGATSATYTPPSGLTSTTSYRRYANDGTCNTTATVSTATWTVTVYDSFTSGTISSTGQSICSGGTPTEIGSTTAASGGDGSITYSWRSSSDSYSAAIDGATSTTYTPPSGLTVTTSYRRYANDGTCNTTATVSTATWTVTVFDTFTSGAIETTGETICNGGDPVTIGSDTDASGGDDSITYKWKANGVDIESTNSATYNPPSGLTTTTTYTRYAKDANCNTTFELSSGSYVVTVTAAPASAGNNGSILLCAGITLTETLLYNALTGSPAAGGTWSPTIPTSGSVAGTYTYTQGSSPCAVNTATVTVTDSEIVTWNGSWSPSAPTASTSAVIQSTYETSENITACSLRVTSGATVVILSGTVTLNGPIIAEPSNSFVTFNNNSILLQNGSGYVNTGNINYNKASSPIFRLDYTLWSSPLTAASQPIFSFSPQTLTNRFYTYNEITNLYTTDDMYSSGTPALSASSSFKVGRGYLIRSPNNWVSSPSAAAWTGTFTGVPNNGDISVAINRTTGDVYGYNAVGNPYPSPISIASFLSDNSGVIGSTLWFWRKTNGVSGSAYITYSAGTYSSGSQSVYNIQPGQGFFVRATSSGSLQFKNSQRVGTNGPFFRNNSQTTAVGEGRLWLNLKSNAIVVGNMALGYKEGATNDFDLLYDAEYLNDSPLALTSSLPGKELSIQHRAAPFVDTDVVPLSFKTDVAGTYSIDFNGTDGVLDTQDIYIEDLLLGQSVAIKTTPYTFASAAGTFSDRFRIVYIYNALGTDVPVFNANQVVIYKNEINDFVINSGNVIMSNIKVYDVRGRLLQEYKNVNDSQTTINVGSVNQVLLVQITSEEGLMVTKKVIR
jgi:hypothetical protein